MKKGFFIGLFCILVNTLSFAEISKSCVRETCSISSWLDQKTATGNWQGARQALEKKGITFSSNYTTDILGNPVGGLKQRLSYAGFLDVGIAFDLEKIASLKGMALTVTNYWASGNNLSSEIGNFFGVQEIYTAGNYFFGELDLSQTLFNNRLTVEVGRLFAGDVFAKSPLWQYYVSSGINGNFASLEGNVFFPSFNIATWAARLSYEPNKNWQFIGGIYNADTKVTDPDNHGVVNC